MAVPKKPRATTYEKPFAIKGTFEDVTGVAMKKNKKGGKKHGPIEPADPAPPTTDSGDPHHAK